MTGATDSGMQVRNRMTWLCVGTRDFNGQDKIDAHIDEWNAAGWSLVTMQLRSSNIAGDPAIEYYFVWRNPA